MNNFISAKEAKLLGISELFFSYFGIGDDILFMHAIEQYFKRYDKKLLVTVGHPDLFKDVDYCYILKDFPPSNIFENKEYHKDTIVVQNVELNPQFITFSIYREWEKNPTKYTLAWPLNAHMVSYCCEQLGMDGEINVNPQIYLSEKEKKFGRFFKENQIAISSQGIMKYKDLGIEKMQSIVDSLKDRYNFVQIGSPKDVRLKDVIDKRGVFSLREVASVLYNSDLYIGNIGGLMHLARAVNCPSVIAYSSAEPLMLDSYLNNENVLPEPMCTYCAEGKLDSLHEKCPKNYECINNITVESMVNAVEKLMNKAKKNSVNQIVKLNPHKVSGMENFYKAINVISEPDAFVETINTEITKKYFCGVLISKKIVTRNKKKKYLFGFIRIK